MLGGGVSAHISFWFIFIATACSQNTVPSARRRNITEAKRVVSGTFYKFCLITQIVLESCTKFFPTTPIPIGLFHALSQTGGRWRTDGCSAGRAVQFHFQSTAEEQSEGMRC